MAANQNPQQPQQPQGQQPQQVPQGQQQYSYPPPGYYPQPQYCQPQPPKDEGIGVWTALGLVGAGFLLGQLFSEPAPQQPTPPQPGLKMPWQK